MPDVNEYNPLELVEDVAEQMAETARQRHIQINGFAAPELPRSLVGQDAHLKALLKALVRESFNGMTIGGVMVEALEITDGSKEFLRFAVTDSRTQLDAQQMQRLMETLLGRQTEMGSVREVLKELDTELMVDTRVGGRVTRIEFFQKLQRGHHVPEEPALSPALLATKVFLVSNDPPPNRVIQHYCRYAGIQLEGAPTASEAMTELGRSANEDPFEILAVATPIEDMTHQDIARAIRQSELRDLKMLYVAPFNDAEDRLKAMSYGFDHTASKPLKRADLFDALEHLVGRLDKKVIRRPLLLIVEDNQVNAKVAMFQLRGLGFDTEIASNGKEALHALAARCFDGVIMDLQMPVMDGVEATSAIRAGQTGDKELPIIALTANETWRDKAQAAGVNAFLTKPATKEQLRAALETCLRKARQR